MCTEEFSVTLDVIVSPKERPNAAASCPWHGYSSKGLSPKVLFTKKEELLAVTAEFGKCSRLNLCNLQISRVVQLAKYFGTNS